MEDYFFILGYPIEKRSVYIFLAVISILLIGLSIGYYFVFSEKWNTNPQTFKTSPALASRSGEDPLEVESASEVNEPNRLTSILDAHLEATGMGELKSFTMKGSSGDGNPSNRFFYIRARYPNLYSFKVKFISPEDEQSIEFGYDGNQNWIDKRWLDQAFDSEANEAMQKNAVLTLCSIAHLAWVYQLEQAADRGPSKFLNLMPMKYLDRQECYIIRSKGILPFEMDHYIDADTFHEIYRTAWLKKPDGTTIRIDVETVSSQLNEAIHFPTVQNIFESRQLIYQIQYESIQVNVTLMNALFQSPAIE